MYQHLQFQLPQFIETGYLLRVKSLCNESNINQSFYLGRTPLHIAIICSQVDIIKYLLTLKPNFQKKDQLGLTVMDWAYYLRNKHVQEIILAWIPYTQIQHQNWSKLQLHRCAQLSPQSLSKKIKKQNPYMRGLFKRNALHWAALSGNIESWNILLNIPLDPYIEDEFGFNCFHYLKNKYNSLHYLVGDIQHGAQTDFQVIIVGGGASGIGAALTLHRKGVPYIILQARDRLGGRVHSTKIDEVQIDLGACWVHSYNKNNPIAKQIKNLNWPSKKSSGYTGSHILDELTGVIPDKVSMRAHMHYQRFFQISQMNAKKSDKDLSIYQSARQYYDNTICSLPPVQKRLVNMLINMTQHYQAASIQQLSSKNYDSKTDYGGDFTPNHSYYALLMAIAKGLHVKLNTQVKQIKYSKDGVEVHCNDANIFTSKKVIVSVPLGILKQKIIKFVPDLPDKHKKSIQKLGFGVMNKIIMAFQKPFWKQGTSWIRLACQQRGKYPCIYNFSTNDKYILCCFITDNFAKKISLLTDQEIISDIIKSLTISHKNKKILLKSATITRWNTDQYSLGSYTHFKTNSSMQDAKNLRESIMNILYFIGQHCYGEHIGTAHGAFQTGVWSASQILTSLKMVNLQKKSIVHINDQNIE